MKGTFVMKIEGRMEQKYLMLIDLNNEDDIKKHLFILKNDKLEYQKVGKYTVITKFD